MKNLLIGFILIFISCSKIFAQNDFEELRAPDKVSFGPGLGYEYGGLGANITVYPQKNIGLFVGGGYVIAGFGYNAGIKLRLYPEKPSVVNPYFTAMYGYNAAVYISENTQLNKIFYGPSFGVGIDLHRKMRYRGYFSFAVMVPVRNADASNYVDNLKNQGYSLNSLSPVGVSLGYKFILSR